MGFPKKLPRLGARNKLRILYIVTAYSRSEGDVITPWLVRTIHRLAERGVEVEVLAPSYRGLGDQVMEGVRVHRFRYAPSRWEDLTHDQTAPDRVRDRPAYLALVPGYVAAGSLAAARLARSGRFDAIHAHWPIPHGVMAMVAARLSGLPMVLTFYGVELTWARNRMPAALPLLRRMIRKADAVTAISTYTAGLVRALYERAIEVIPFGATVSAPEAVEPPPPPSRPFRLLFVGRLVERKGVAYLLRAISTLDGEPDVRLEVVGSGPEREKLESLAAELGIAERVEFAGFVPDDELAGRYRDCHAFVLPASHDAKGDVEGLGVVLLEAMVHARPVIASAAGGITDIVEHERTGLLVEPADVNDLAAAIRRLASDPGLADRVGRAGREHARREFSWDAIMNRLVALYRGLVEPTAS